MNQEENVYEKESSRTEEGVRTQTGAEKESGPSTSAVPGKFKDVDALAKAYESLQAEFTRRSQRLKQLEKLAENFSDGQGEKADSGAEKLRKNAQRMREEKKAFDQFLLETETLSNSAQEEESAEKRENLTPMYEVNGINSQTEAAKQEEREEEDAKRSEVKNARPLGSGELSVVHTENVESSEALYRKVQENEEVRLKIIGEYLRSIGKSIAPLTVGGGTAVTPPLKPHNIKDAGQMALSYFKNAAVK